ncbi:MAG: T9SS type A sorting domain-containing protein, partial [Sphingobacteriales bacterium]
CEGVLTANFTASNNIIGSITTANSIQYSGSTANPTSINGMFLSTSGASFTTSVAGNTIQNLTSTGTGATGLVGPVCGIYNLSTSLASLTSNTIANISSAEPASQTIIGIYAANTTAGQTVSGNIIHDLSNTDASGSTSDVYGIYYSGPVSGTNVVQANAVYNLKLSSTATASTIYGAYFASGLATTSNNMITLGNGVNTGYGIYGIYDAAGTNGNTFYFNSVYLGGIAAGGTSTNGFYSNITNARTVKNNIFYNARTSGGGVHYAIYVTSKTGLTSDYNDLLSATDVGRVSFTSDVTLANWQTSSVQDAHSVNVNPSFLSPTAASPNLHITVGSGVINLGLNGTGITSDFDNSIRSITPDIGAHEFHTSYYSKSTGNLDLIANWGTNTDGSGTNPPNFTTADCNFYIRNNATPTIGASWAVTGDAALIVLGDGTNPCNFTIPGAFSCTGSINISSNGTLTNQNAVNPTLKVLDPNSTVNYNSGNGVAQTVPQAVTAYGYLILSNATGSGSSTKTLAATISIVDDLTVNGYAVFDIAAFNANRTGGGGTLTVASNGTFRLSGTTGGASASNNFPTGFSTMTLAAAGTVEYYGATQTIYNIPTYGNLTITTAGTKTAGGDLTIAGNLTLNAASTFAASTYVHNVAGNFLNSGIFTASTSTINFNGTTAQNIGPAGGSNTTFSTLQVNNAAGVSLLQDANVSTSLVLTIGLLNTAAAGSGLLVMQPGSAAPALTSASTSYVNGPMKYQKNTAASAVLNFPIGKSPDCRPVILTVAHTTASLYNYLAESFNASSDLLAYTFPGTVDTVSNMHYYTINRTDVSSVSQPTLDLSGNQTIQLFFGINDSVTNGAYLTIVKNIYTATTTWIDIGGAGAPAYSGGAKLVGSITSTSSPTAFNSFSTFALGNKLNGGNPLPVELLDFSAVPDMEVVDLKWSTVSEVNCDHFTIEKCQDGVNFNKVMDTKGAGSSTSMIDYFEKDYQPYAGTSYYRLKQTDFNGGYKYYPMIAVKFKPAKSITLFPNPTSKDNINLSFQGYQNEQVLVVLRDINGNEFYSKALVVKDANEIFFVNVLDSIAAGTYIVVASSDNKIYSYKLIIK